MPQNSSNYLKIPQNAPKYVLQDYRGISWRAPLPPIPEALVMVDRVLGCGREDVDETETLSCKLDRVNHRRRSVFGWRSLFLFSGSLLFRVEGDWLWVFPIARSNSHCICERARHEFYEIDTLYGEMRNKW